MSKCFTPLELSLEHSVVESRSGNRATILAAQRLDPEMVPYNRECRDPDFDVKIRDSLLVYGEIDLQNQAGHGLLPSVETASVDEQCACGGGARGAMLDLQSAPETCSHSWRGFAAAALSNISERPDVRGSANR